MRRDISSYSVSRPFTLVLTLALFAGSLWLYSVSAGTAADPAAGPPAPMTAFTGGTFEASGVAHVPGTDGVLFVDDGRDDEVFWMRLTGGRAQAGEIKAIGL